MFHYRGRARRVIALDELRGVVIILMILFHLGYDLVYLFGVSLPFYLSNFVQRGIQPFIACSFTLISGVACRFSKNNLRRGGIVFGLACAMTLVTRLFMPEQVIWFGVLHMLGISMMLFGVAESFRNQNGEAEALPAFWQTLLFALLFVATYSIRSGVLGLAAGGGALSLRLPASLYQSVWLAPLGFPGPGFHSSDYFPLLPWSFLFFAGTSLGVLFRRGDMPEFFYRSHVPALEWLGRRSLPIYLLHQPVTYAILLLTFRLGGLVAGAVA